MSTTMEEVAAMLPMLKTRARHLTRNEHDAADLMQSTFMRAVRYAHSYEGTAPLLHWLHRVMFSTHRDRFRRGTGERGKYYYNDPHVSIEAMPGFDISVPASQEDAWEAENALRRLAHLPAIERETLTRFVAGEEQPEIAVHMNTKRGTVKSRLNRARAMLTAAHK